MRRILFSWNGFNIYSYPAMLYLGLISGVFAGAHVAQLSGMNPDRFALATVILLIPTMIGARLFFVLTHWDDYRREISRIWRRSEGGLAIFGGLVAGVAFSVPLLHAMQLPFAVYWDAATVAFLIALFIARVGCLLNGCCAGRPTGAWYGLYLPDHRGVWQRRIPTQILEMFWTAVLFGFAIMIRDRAPFAGMATFLVVIAFSASRYFLETLRDDETGGRNTGIIQVTSILLLIVGLAGLILAWSW
jgi:phosphatidylglycerol:prolipoprotein diacylglycerol transferase